MTDEPIAEQVDVIPPDLAEGPQPPPFEPLTEDKIKELIKTKRTELAVHAEQHNAFSRQVQAQIDASMKRAIEMEGAINFMESLLPKPPQPEKPPDA